MKQLKWIIFVPIALLASYLSFLLLSFFQKILNIFRTEENIIMDGYIMPILANIIGVYMYFMMGNFIIQIDDTTKKSEKIISNIILLIVVLAISLYFSYLSFDGGEYFKGILNIINSVVSVLFYSYYKEHKNETT